MYPQFGIILVPMHTQTWMDQHYPELAEAINITSTTSAFQLAEENTKEFSCDDVSKLALKIRLKFVLLYVFLKSIPLSIIAFLFSSHLTNNHVPK